VKVLIADDSRAMRRIIAAMLREAGFRKLTIVEAGDGAEALGKAVEEMPDVVISDWNMPNMTGIQFLQGLRKQGIDIPFGFVTTEVSPEMRELATDAGSSFLIGKPFTPTDFVRALSEFLD
jgi:two-component system, chemotaxis family, chemotaxis protein CheY